MITVTETADRILIVDDEENIRTVLAEGLQARGYETLAVSSADEALSACDDARFDLALIDLRLPGAMDGINLLSQIHSRWPQMVIIMLTGYATLDSSITAMRQGAYDYLVKPASLAQITESIQRGLTKRREETKRLEVIARLEETLHELKRDGLTTQVDAAVTDRFIQTPTMTIDRQKRLAVRGNKPLMLTATEFDLLEFLVRHSDRVVTARELVKSIQGYDLAEPDARPIIRVHIQRLRRKLEDDPAHPRYILNVRSKGYRFVG